MNEEKKNNETKEQQEKKHGSPRPLLQLLPAVVVSAAIVLTLPMTSPVLQQIPKRLEVEAAEIEEKKPVVKEKEEEEDIVTELLPYADGTYEGESQGYGGIIRVRVTMSGGRITNIEILEAPGETEPYITLAKTILDTVMKRQTWEVDIVSGATFSSRGILGAIQNALTGETVENEAAETVTPDESALVAETFSEPASYKDGVYTGSATGFGGTITVSVTISGGKIADVSVLSAPGETASYLSQAMSVVSAIVSSGSPNVDTVSGATYSSTGIINAVKRALSQAAGSGSADLTIKDNTSNKGNTDPVPTAIPADPDAKPSENYKDGTYTGSGEGFGGEVKVQVTVKDGRIDSIDVLSAEDETPSYFERAKVMLTNMVSTQSTEVDAISGATFSSEGLREAVKAALAQAKTDEETPTPTPTVTPTPTPTVTPTPTPDVDPDTSKYEDGTYTAVARCTDKDEDGMTFDYQVAVTVTIEKGVISRVTVEKQEDVSEEPEDNETYLDRAMNGYTRKDVTYTGVIEQILNKQSAEDVDAVSRATYSSDAIAKAAKEALAKAEKKKEEVTPTPTPTPTPAPTPTTEPGEDTGNAKYTDGTYTTTVRCTDEDEEGVTFDYQLAVTIKIEDDKITSVTAEKQEDVSEEPEENEKYLGYALNGRIRKGVTYTGVVEQILTKQSEEVDAVSGATYSSDAVKTAVRQLLEEATAVNSSKEGGEQS